MTVKKKIKPDAALKDFWRDRERFADLFNGTLFGGEKVLDPRILQEADTDMSTVIKTDDQAETVEHFPDVVKKSMNGVDFMLLGLENQMKIHYAMPLRNLTGETLAYLKEYREKAKKNRAEGKWDSGDEFLSGLRKEDRLHPAVSLCVYYGETEWDGPQTLREMLDMERLPAQLKEAVQDYRLNLVQVAKSESSGFQHAEVRDFFEIMQSIYRRDYKKIEEVYGTREISTELGLAVGAAAESEKLMKHALEEKGGRMNMCTALQELEDTGRREGRIEGHREGRIEGHREGRIEGHREGKIEGIIEGIVKTCMEFGVTEEETAEKLRMQCSLGEKAARKYLVQYYRHETKK